MIIPTSSDDEPQTSYKSKSQNSQFSKSSKSKILPPNQIGIQSELNKIITSNISEPENSGDIGDEEDNEEENDDILNPTFHCSQKDDEVFDPSRVFDEKSGSYKKPPQKEESKLHNIEKEIIPNKSQWGMFYAAKRNQG